MSNVRYTDFQEILDSAMSDKVTQVPLVNVAKVDDPKAALEVISGCFGKIYQPYSMMLGERNKAYYPKVFTHTGGMGGSFMGSGAILSRGEVYTFFMCEHVWDESGANHSRGWHPKKCRKCGFDASIDSGD